MKKKNEKNKMIKIVAVGGPTASGKTAASLKLAREFNGVIISCDSRQIYRELDIATDKIPYSLPYHDPINFGEIDHYGINIAQADKIFSLYDWQVYANKVIKKIVKDGKIPFLVGGTGLYIQAIIDGYNLENDFDPKLREELNTLTLLELQKRLKSLDPTALEKIDGNNPRRVMRAVEKLSNRDQVLDTRCQVLGKGVKIETRNYSSLVLSFAPLREVIKKKIIDRVEEHIKNGVLDEVKELVKKYGADNQILNSTISIQEYIPYVLGKISLADAKKQVVINNYHYAKRQMTWFRKYGNTVFCEDFGMMRERVKKHLKCLR